MPIDEKELSKVLNNPEVEKELEAFAQVLLGDDTVAIRDFFREHSGPEWAFLKDSIIEGGLSTLFRTDNRAHFCKAS